MSVMVLGATGFIGPRVVDALAALGRDVVAVSRTGGGSHGVPADRSDTLAIRTLARRRGVTAVIDLLAYTRTDTEGLLAAMDGRVERWVMASSCDVYRNYEGLHRKASVEPVLEPLGEASPLRTTCYPYRLRPRRPRDAPDAWMDDYDKIPLEAAIRGRPGLGAAILRLPMVYGPGDRQRRFRWAIRPMASGIGVLRLDPGWAAWRTTYGYVSDVAHALAVAAIHPAASGRTFNIGDGGLDHRAWIERFAAILDWRGEIEDAPSPPDSPLAAFDLRYSLATDTRAFREACAWREPTPTEEALARTIADEAARG